MVKELTGTADPAKRGALVIAMNDMLTKDGNVVIPLVHRGKFSAISNTIEGAVLSAWDSELWNVAEWRRAK